MKIKTAEEILEKLTGESIDTLRKNYVSIDVILQAMKAYADQLELTDEEIEAGLREYYNSGFLRLTDSAINELAKGAKWYKAELKRRRNET